MVVAADDDRAIWHLEKCPLCDGRGGFKSEPRKCRTCAGVGILSIDDLGNVLQVQGIPPKYDAQGAVER